MSLVNKGKKSPANFETTTTFGLMQFGSDALENWGDDLFYYRTGIAFKLWDEKYGSEIIHKKGKGF